MHLSNAKMNHPKNCDALSLKTMKMLGLRVGFFFTPGYRKMNKRLLHRIVSTVLSKSLNF